MESNYSQFLWKASLGFASSIKFLVNFHPIDPGGLKLWDQYFSNKAGARQCWAEDWIPTEMKCKEAFMITLGPSILLSVIKWYMMIPQQPWVLFNRQATDCRHTSFYCTLLYCVPQMLSFSIYKLKARPFINKKITTCFIVAVWNQPAISEACLYTAFEWKVFALLVPVYQPAAKMLLVKQCWEGKPVKPWYGCLNNTFSLLGALRISSVARILLIQWSSGCPGPQYSICWDVPGWASRAAGKVSLETDFKGFIGNSRWVSFS